MDDEIVRKYEFEFSYEFIKSMNSSIEIIKRNFIGICYRIEEEDNKIYLMENSKFDHYNYSNEEIWTKHDLYDLNPKEKFYLLVILIRNGGYTHLLDKILHEHTDININDENNLLLNVACRKNNINIVKNLIELGVDVTFNNNLAIKIASKYCNYDNIDIMKLLINNGANVHVDDDYVLCCASHNPLLFKYLIDLGCEYNFSARNDYCLRQCIKNFYSNSSKLYYLESVNNFESTLIQPIFGNVMESFAYHTHDNIKENIFYDSNDKSFVMSDIIKYLLDLGINVNCCDGFIINYIIEKCDTYLAKLIIQYGANLNLLTNDTLSRIIHYRNYEMVSFLIDNDVDFSRLNVRPIENNQFNKMVNLLISQGVNLENIISLI
ncbi:ankyrin repeat protein [Moumouvirus australiensis]|uniref:Ankyrin repeat protein n=1 Tax=Moumouvirus australiensis TaxID=2109587 RepID=A0A2P1EKW0_9VIRU|nr:ankyrin repeat protein [Moumouvirus australiensis]AVL94523.1 ankyrin repeat protein [Moumouvirus australiensis]